MKLRVWLSVLLVCACAAAQANHAKGHDKGKAKTAAVKVAPEVVAEGFPKWTGLDSRIGEKGRAFTAAELRGAYTVVVVMDSGTLKKQIATTLGLASLGGENPKKRDWAFGGFGRGISVIFVVRGGLERDINSLGKDKKLGKNILEANINWYSALTFEGAPGPDGKGACVYVMAPGELKPIFQATADGKKTRAQVMKAIDAFEQKTAPWRPWFGNVKEPVEVKTYAALIAGVKPLAPTLMTLQKNVTSKKAALARESQLLHDAIEATKGFYVARIREEAKLAPQVALYEGADLCKRLPKAREEIAAALERASSQPDALAMSRILAAYYATADEAQQLALLKKSRGQLEKMKESKCIPVQNTAFTFLQKIQ